MRLPRFRVLLPGVLTLIALAPVGSQAASARCSCGEVVNLLHDGRFDEADRLVHRDCADPQDPEAAFLRAFVTYWRLLYDDENPTLRQELRERLDRAVEVGEQDANRRSTPGRDAAAWAGSARLLAAQLYADERKVLKAAYEAKRAKRQLEAALEEVGAPEAPYFGLGTYNYYASQVSALIKGIRFLLALPGGNRELGLRQLERAARKSPCLGLEARLLLVTILSGDHERRYAEALEQLNAALEQAPQALAALHAASLVDLSLGRPESALQRLDRALERASSEPGTDRSMARVLRFHRARAELALFRPDLALETLRPLYEDRAELPVSLWKDALKLLQRARHWSDAPPWLEPPPPPGDADSRSGHPGAAAARPDERFRDALRAARKALDLEREGRDDESAAALLKLADEHPNDPGLDLLAGRALLRTGDAAAGFQRLARAARSPELPPAWQGPCYLLAGRAADSSGERARALWFYRKAQKAPPFIGKDAAYFHEQIPYRSGD